MLKLYAILKQIYDKIVDTYNLVAQFYEKIYNFAIRLKVVFPQVIKEIWGITYTNPDNPEIPNAPSRIDRLEDSYQNYENLKEELNTRLQLRRVDETQELVLNNRYFDNEDCKKIINSKLGNLFYLLKQNIPIPIYTTAVIINPSEGNIQPLDIFVNTKYYFGYNAIQEENPPQNTDINLPFESPLLIDPFFSQKHFNTLDIFSDPYLSVSQTTPKFSSLGFKLYMYYQNEVLPPLFKLNADCYLPLLFITENSRRWSQFNFIFVLSYYKYLSGNVDIYQSITIHIMPFLCFLKYNSQTRMYEIKTDLDINFGANSLGLIPMLTSPFSREFKPHISRYYEIFRVYYNWKNLPNIRNLQYPTDCEFIGIGIYATWTLGIANQVSAGEYYNLFHFNFPIIQLIGYYNLTHFWAHEPEVELKLTQCSSQSQP